ncbi:MAG TPA: flagellar biosynthetic protein FliO [Caulobacteraceae bacterium]|nr:flagellar biosynthetic protein FliO [Caulobacteraceae bacterium]
MSLGDLLRWFFSLAITLGLFGLAVVAMRKWGPGVFRTMQAPKGPRRLMVVESLLLDPQRRLVLVSLDGREKLILLGEGRMLSEHSAEAA